MNVRFAFAASGGVGHLAVQVFTSLGARVVGVCGQRNAAFVRKWAEAVVAYDEGRDVVEALQVRLL